MLSIVQARGRRDTGTGFGADGPFPDFARPNPRPKSAPLARSYTDYRVMEMQLNAQEASLVEAFRRLPPDAAAELSALAERLAGLTPNRKIDWSDSWSDEDLKEFRAASLRRLDAEESEDPGRHRAMWWLGF